MKHESWITEYIKKLRPFKSRYEKYMKMIKEVSEKDLLNNLQKRHRTYNVVLKFGIERHDVRPIQGIKNNGEVIKWETRVKFQ